MKLIHVIRIASVILLLGSFSLVSALLHPCPRRLDVRRLLSQLGDVSRSHDELAALFQVGDERVEELIQALDDPDPKVRFNARIMLRYLGGDAGREGLRMWITRHAEFPTGGPVPIPLSEQDYQFIAVRFLSRPADQWFESDKYIYALALDDSPRARNVLHDLIAIAGGLDESTTAGRTIKFLKAKRPGRQLIGRKDVAELVLENAFFMSPGDLKRSSSELLALNGAKDKALVSIHVNRGPLAEEWYHIVLKKTVHGWEFLSISRVARS